MNKNLILSVFVSFGIALSPALYAKSDDSDSRASSPKQRSDNKQVNKQKTTREVGAAKRADKTKKPKNPKQVRTTVVPKKAAVGNSPARVSQGTSLGLGKHVDELNLKSSVAMIVDQQTLQVLFEKNPQSVLPIASITKLLTAMTVLDAQLPLDEILEINAEDAAIYRNSRLAKGADLSRREALLLALMSSENRAAYTLGRNYPGGITNFMSDLNRKARDIGMLHSNFEDPTGLTSKNVASAEDLAILVNAAYQYPLIREYSTATNHKLLVNNRAQEFISSNRLVRSGDMEIGLQKTGYISEAGRCLDMQATVKNRPVIMVFVDSAGSLSRLRMLFGSKIGWRMLLN
jgi:D-alanyl-D-alanine endopeptidase (penicillin-binding protein 7)